MVGYNGAIYVIEGDFNVGVPRDNYYAIGGGSPFAFGSLHSTRGSSLTPVQRVTMALEAAAAYKAGVRGPFTILQLPEDETTQ